LESGSQVLPADELMANEYLWSQVTMGEYLVKIVYGTVFSSPF
jgi:hypothetical protein